MGTNFSVTTPHVSFIGPLPSATPEGRRVGVRSRGAYWGASPENIDVLSGNPASGEKYSGDQQDSETGLNYVIHRYQQPGIFTTVPKNGEASLARPGARATPTTVSGT